MLQSRYLILLFSFLLLLGCSKESSSGSSDGETLQLISVQADNQVLRENELNTGIATDAVFVLRFGQAISNKSINEVVRVLDSNSSVELDASMSLNSTQTQLTIYLNEDLAYLTEYNLEISSNLKGDQGEQFPGLNYRIQTENGKVEIVSATINGANLSTYSATQNVDPNQIEIKVQFSEAVSAQAFQDAVRFLPNVGYIVQQGNSAQEVVLSTTESLDYYSSFFFQILNTLSVESGFEVQQTSYEFTTGLDSTYKFQPVSDEALMDLVQERTFKYFYDYAHPVSGLARERLNSGDVVTTGGSGFGLMGIVVGIHRNMISRSQGIEHFTKVVSFLEQADRFHGVWPHWLNGSTGSVYPFSQKDNGADLVETAFLAQGLIVVRQFLNPTIAAESDLIDRINVMLDEIEWTWFQQNDQDVLYWHWSPQYNWDMNMRISGYNEALIIYVLAAASKTHSIDANVYHNGWARNGGMVNGKSFYGHQLPLGYDYGGPLFFAHYSFLGLSPQGLSDTYANYWEQNRQHTLINYEHCVRNPNGYIGYSDASWGLTASDNPSGYSAQSPTNDNGTITPTAALSSIPYTPEQSLKAMHHFYEILGDKLWGEYGFYDAYNPKEGWWASSYLAIDQGPILVMIENYRSGLIWDLFMSAPEVHDGLDKLGFTTEYTTKIK